MPAPPGSTSVDTLTPARAGNEQNRLLREYFGFLRDVVAEMERSVPYASALAKTSDGVRLSLRDGEQHASRRDPAHGVVLSAFNGRYLEEEATADTSPESVWAASRTLVERVAAQLRQRPNGPTYTIDPGAALDADYATPVAQDPATVRLAEKLARFEGLRQQARQLDTRVVQASARYGDGTESKVFVSRSRFLTEVLYRTDLFMTLFVSDGTQRRYDWLRHGGTGGLELLGFTREELDALRDSALALLDATPVPPGTYDVVTAPSVTGVLAHEAFGHGVETDMFVKGRARGAHFIDQVVGSPLVTIMDDPTQAGANGAYFFDDEGQPAAPTCIIKDGVLQRGISDLFSATRLGITRSANGRRESFERKAYARMSNTFFAPGAEHTPVQLLDSLEDGLYVCQCSSGMEDPKGWGIQVSALYAREYKGGKPTGRVFSPISITGYVPDVLKSVSMVADDFVLEAGMCGKGSKEYVPVADGGPHLRLRLRLG